jgi:glycosyltransferase involved in cell wall biosynthesis
MLLRALGKRPDVIWTRQDLYTVAPVAVGRLIGVPVVVEVNVSIPDELAAAGNERALRVASWCERVSLARAGAVVVLSSELGARLSARIQGIGGRLHIVPIATHLPRLEDPGALRAALQVPTGRFVIGFAGNLTRIQGVETLVQAFAGLEDGDAELWIIGAGTEEGSLRAIAAKNCDRVKFFGALDREETDRRLSACQILVAPYAPELYARVTGGATSTKVLTYLAHDRPILISDLADYASLREMGTIFPFRAGDPAALRAALAEWALRWRGAGRPLRDWPWPEPGPGRIAIERNGTWAHRARRIESIIRRLLEGASRSRGAAGEAIEDAAGRDGGAGGAGA